MTTVRDNQLPLGAGTATEVPPRTAASVILVRRHPFEVLLFRRSEASSFVPGAWVFPGGTVDEIDLQCAAAVGDESEETVARLCAIREAFEETGVWLGDPLDESESVRAELLADPAFFRGLLDCARPALDSLVLHARWITPVGIPKRFDTLFFIALVDDETTASPEHMEGTEVRWLRPSEALAENENGEFPLIFPTMRNLKAIEHFETSEYLIEDRRNATIEITRPVLIIENGKKRIVIPGES